MTPAERLAEIGALLATAVRRMQHSGEKELDDEVELERPCNSVDSSENASAEEVA